MLWNREQREVSISWWVIYKDCCYLCIPASLLRPLPFCRLIIPPICRGLAAVSACSQFIEWDPSFDFPFLELVVEKRLRHRSRPVQLG